MHMSVHWCFYLSFKFIEVGYSSISALIDKALNVGKKSILVEGNYRLIFKLFLLKWKKIYDVSRNRFKNNTVCYIFKIIQYVIY